MKKPVLLCLAFLLFFLDHTLFAQLQPVQEYNRWGLKSIGFSATYGGEEFFEPLTFAYFKQNSIAADNRYFELPPGASNTESTYLEDVTPLGLGLQLAWPVGKRQNEVRVGFAFQQHWNDASVSSRYNISPDTIRFHSVRLIDEYVISQASFDYVFYTKPIFRNARFLGRLGSTFGVSTRHDITHKEEITDLDTADIHFSQIGGSYGYDPRKAKSFTETTGFDSKVRLEAGVRASVGLEIILNIFHQQIGFSAEYGHGLAGQKVLNGGTANLKRTELGQVQARYFLR